jgi:hypothetical protein
LHAPELSEAQTQTNITNLRITVVLVFEMWGGTQSSPDVAKPKNSKMSVATMKTCLYGEQSQ